MLYVGHPAPDIALEDQFGRVFRLREAIQRRNVLLLFYPRDWTPICTGEVPEIARMAGRFLREANTLVVALNTDSRFCHLNWAADLGGVAMPILADSAPYGAVSRAYGAWIQREGISDRATVIVDRSGRVAYAKSVGKMGRRDMTELLRAARAVAARDRAPVPPVVETPTVAPAVAATVYLSRTCHHCKNVERTLRNLGCTACVAARYVGPGEDPAASDELAALYPGASPEVPTLVINGRVLKGDAPIVAELSARFGRSY